MPLEYAVLDANYTTPSIILPNETATSTASFLSEWWYVIIAGIIAVIIWVALIYYFYFKIPETDKPVGT
jgi:hypothetical protein